jgi:very-short-patch-repair endonuclease
MRIVLEVDGKQHYADGDLASPRHSADMVREDRALRLPGYEIYRLRRHELPHEGAEHMLVAFFEQSMTRYAR